MQRYFYIETYGCQMNFSDSEIVASILIDNGYNLVDNYKNADIILINTCSVRENAENRVFNRVKEIQYGIKKLRRGIKIGIIGCMAERLKEYLLDNKISVDLVAGPDSYRNLLQLIKHIDDEYEQTVNVPLSKEETYADITPFRLDFSAQSKTAFISIMRGCENFCSYCVVPYTRGKVRYREPNSIIQEAENLFENGYRQITLLGQNVISYKYEKNGISVDFPHLLERIAIISPLLRVRFTTSHPKDFSDEIIVTIKNYKNICRTIHLPVQSGNNRILELMNRKYTREYYIGRIQTIKEIISEISITTDIITGFPTETEGEHKETLSLMELAEFDYAYMFKYSERSGTEAEKKYKDDISEEVKQHRLNEIIELQKKLSLKSNLKDLSKVHQVLIEGISKRSKDYYFGRNSQNKVVIFPKGNCPDKVGIGDYVDVLVTDCTSATLIGHAIASQHGETK